MIFPGKAFLDFWNNYTISLLAFLVVLGAHPGCFGSSWGAGIRKGYLGSISGPAVLQGHLGHILALFFNPDLHHGAGGP
ncbi:hypothetical protein ACPA9J_27195 [Pseudomonas aeruginosa]